MRWRLRAWVLVAALAPAAPAAAGPAPDPLAAVFERLPPGARRASDGAGGAAPDGAPPTERITLSDPGGGERRLEVEYTTVPSLERRIRGLLERSEVALGHVILLDPATGDVLAYVSTDPERFPATRTCPMASLMKVVTAAALLRHAPEATRRECRYAGSPYWLGRSALTPPAAGGRLEGFWRSLAISNNQCFARAAVRDLGRDRLVEEMRALGLLEPPAGGHAPGRLDPVPDPLALGRLGSGLAGSAITPLAGARLAATLAAGRLVRPHWISAVRDDRGNVLAVADRETDAAWPPEIADELRRRMVGVTEEGTARAAFHHVLGGIRVAGKTGTLHGSDPDGLYQWFVGVAPAEAPALAIAAVVVDGPASASRIAAATLKEAFCGTTGCSVANLEPLRVPRPAAPALPAVAAEPPATRIVELGEAELDALRGRVALDAPPRPVEFDPLDFPRALRRKKVDGEIVLLIELDPDGRVVDATVDSSDLPDFDAFVVGAVRRWRFTPPTRLGQPVHATARLPVPIRIN